MITAVVFIPAAPLMCPDVDVESLLADERAVSIELIAELQQDAERIIVIGAGTSTTWFEDGGIGNTRGFGGVSHYAIGTGLDELPQSLTVGASVVSATGWAGEVQALVIDADTTIGQRQVLAKEVVANSGDQRTLIVAVGDGSATRTEKAPGYIQPDALDFDAAVVRAIDSVDRNALMAIEQSTADRLWCRGLPTWQVVAQAIDTAHGAVVFESSPFGVNYFVASWRI